MENQTGGKIIIPSGDFSWSLALAWFILKNINPYKHYEINLCDNPVESDDMCDTINLGLGNEYKPDDGKFDWNFRDFDEKFSDKYQIPLGIAGLIYKQFGQKYISSVTCLKGENCERIYRKVYGGLVYHIDAAERRVPQTDEVPKFSSETHLPAMATLRTQLHSDFQSFEKVISQIGECLTRKICGLAKKWLPARQVVLEAVENRLETHSSGRIMYLPKPSPWKAHLRSIEDELDVNIIFVVFCTGPDDWKVQAVPEYYGRPRQDKCGLLESWRGLQDKELQTISGISDAKFVHVNGFIGGAQSLHSCIQMAQVTLEAYDEESKLKLLAESYKILEDTVTFVSSGSTLNFSQMKSLIKKSRIIDNEICTSLENNK